MSNKVKSLARMFAGFPSYRPSPGMLSETVSVYLDVLEIYDDETVQDACARLTREAREFPPTAGEVRAMCERIVVATLPPRPALTDESRPLANDLTPEQRAQNVRRLRELVVELGGGKDRAKSPVSLSRPRAGVGADDARPAGPVVVSEGLAAYLEGMASGSGS